MAIISALVFFILIVAPMRLPYARSSFLVMPDVLIFFLGALVATFFLAGFFLIAGVSTFLAGSFLTAVGVSTFLTGSTGAAENNDFIKLNILYPFKLWYLYFCQQNPRSDSFGDDFDYHIIYSDYLQLVIANNPKHGSLL